MRDYILLYINGNRHIIKGEDVLLTLSSYLRTRCRLTGTKIVCSEGDCGACTVLHASIHPLNPDSNQLNFQAINSCIKPLYLLDCSHVITIEGMAEDGNLHPIQEAMIQFHGSQCGFCTPGFVMALAALFENKQTITEKHIKNYLTGNLCRCTGYQGIILAASQLIKNKTKSLSQRYHSRDLLEDLRKHWKTPLLIENEQARVYAPKEVKDVCLAKNKDSVLFSSATDLGVQINKQGKKPKHIISLNLIDSLYRLEFNDNQLVIGARVTLTELEKYLQDKIPAFADFLKLFASPQIKNTGTLVGNVANASPIADTPPFLLVANAQLKIAGPNYTRCVNINDFYIGYKQIDLSDHEIITDICIPLPQKNDILKIYKVSKRKDLDISCVNAAFRLEKSPDNIIKDIKIAYGGVAPTPYRLKKIESMLRGQEFNIKTIEQVIPLMDQEISPISDVRGSASYRMQISKNLLRKFYVDVSCKEVVS